MTASYSLLFQINCYHNYYNYGICKELIYTPTDITEQLMQRYDFKLVVTPTGFAFYGQEKQTDINFLEYLKESTDAIAFEFEFNSVNINFYRFTDLPINTLGSLAYTSNQIKEDGNGFLLKEVFVPSEAPSNLGSITINFQDLIVLQNKHPKPIQFYIQFTTRATQWKYYIINNSKQHFDELSIQSDEGINFEASEAVILKNGQEALCFSSGIQKIPLKEFLEYEFNLITKSVKLGNESVKTVFKGLPYPNPGQIEIYKENGEDQVVSTMYIYI